MIEKRLRLLGSLEMLTHGEIEKQRNPTSFLFKYTRIIVPLLSTQLLLL